MCGCRLADVGKCDGNGLPAGWCVGNRKRAIHVTSARRLGNPSNEDNVKASFRIARGHCCCSGALCEACGCQKRPKVSAWCTDGRATLRGEARENPETAKDATRKLVEESKKRRKRMICGNRRWSAPPPSSMYGWQTRRRSNLARQPYPKNLKIIESVWMQPNDGAGMAQGIAFFRPIIVLRAIAEARSNEGAL